MSKTSFQCNYMWSVMQDLKRCNGLQPFGIVVEQRNGYIWTWLNVLAYSEHRTRAFKAQESHERFLLILIVVHYQSDQSMWLSNKRLPTSRVILFSEVVFHGYCHCEKLYSSISETRKTTPQWRPSVLSPIAFEFKWNLYKYLNEMDL